GWKYCASRSSKSDLAREVPPGAVAAAVGAERAGIPALDAARGHDERIHLRPVASLAEAAALFVLRRGVRARLQTGVMFAADGPLGPSTTSNCTCWLSLRDLNPLILMLV